MLISWILRVLICSLRCTLRGSGGWRVTFYDFSMIIITIFLGNLSKIGITWASLSFECYLDYLSQSGNLSPKFCKSDIKLQSFTLVPKVPSNPARHYRVSSLNPSARRGITFKVPLEKRQTINVHTMHSLLTAPKENPVP